MAYSIQINHFGVDCVHFVGFYTHKHDNVKAFYRDVVFRLSKDIAKYNGHLIQITLTDNQLQSNPQLLKILEDNGFVPAFVHTNPNTQRVIYMFLRFPEKGVQVVKKIWMGDKQQNEITKAMSGQYSDWVRNHSGSCCGYTEAIPVEYFEGGDFQYKKSMGHLIGVIGTVNIIYRPGIATQFFTTKKGADYEHCNCGHLSRQGFIRVCQYYSNVFEQTISLFVHSTNALPTLSWDKLFSKFNVKVEEKKEELKRLSSKPYRDEYGRFCSKTLTADLVVAGLQL